MFETLMALTSMLQLLRQQCAWTKEQTMVSLAPQTIEEAYELHDAIDQGDVDDIKSELGDLLYHIVFYTQIAQEQGLFSFADVANVAIEKHDERMPSEQERDQYAADEVKTHWEQQKLARLQQQDSILDGVATTIPALMRAVKLQNRAAAVGFDWPDAEPVLEKVKEEFNELTDEMQHDNNQSRINEEYGDLLFVIANLARHLNIDPETALRQANQKFIQRFQSIEAQARIQQQNLNELTLEQMEQYWQQAKNSS